MSKRYGRQQKRKARERIEQLERRLEDKQRELDKTVDDVRHTVNAARGIIETVKQVNPCSALIEASRVSGGAARYSPAPHICNPFVCDQEDFNNPVDMRIIDLFELEATLIKPPFSNMVHFKVEPKSEYEKLPAVCYSASKEALINTPLHLIAKEMTKTLRLLIKNQ